MSLFKYSNLLRVRGGCWINGSKLRNTHIATRLMSSGSLFEKKASLPQALKQALQGLNYLPHKWLASL